MVNVELLRTLIEAFENDEPAREIRLSFDGIAFG